MAVKHALMVETVQGATDLTLTPPVGDAYIVKKVYIDTPATDYVTLTTGKTTVGYFRVGGVQGNHLHLPTVNAPFPNLLDYLSEHKLFHNFPIAEGETFTIKGASGTGATQIVVYDIVDAGDVKPTDINGSQATSYDFFAYGTPSSIATSTSALYDTATTPEEFPRFPFSAAVPAKTKITLYGYGITPFSMSNDTDSNEQRTMYIKFVRERTVLFDLMRNGIPLIGSNVYVSPSGTTLGGITIVGNDTDVDYKSVLLFPKPLEFVAGEELDVYNINEVDKGVGNFVPSDVEICLLAFVEPTT